MTNSNRKNNATSRRGWANVGQAALNLVNRQMQLANQRRRNNLANKQRAERNRAQQEAWSKMSPEERNRAQQ